MFMWSEACMDQEMRVLVTLEKRAAGLASITELCLLEEEESLVQEDWRNQRFWPVLSLWWLFSLSQPSFCRGWSTADCSIAFHIRIWPLDCRHMAFKFFVPIVITHLLVSSHSQCHPHSLCEDFTRGPSGLHRRNPREWCPRKLPRAFLLFWCMPNSPAQNQFSVFPLICICPFIFPRFSVLLFMSSSRVHALSFAYIHLLFQLFPSSTPILHPPNLVSLTNKSLQDQFVLPISLF